MRLFNTQEASSYLKKKGVRVAPAYLKKLRSVGSTTGAKAPPFHRQGRFVVYSDEELDQYADKILAETLKHSFRSTSDYKRREPKPQTASTPKKPPTTRPAIRQPAKVRP
jgi:hypothetical protein